ncbi:molybdenum cofactor biosynthesis protein MoaE [Sphingomonas sp. TX0543]|uniref:molybdenum cofactor biosynthesis protein MoaE n=1 Tax=Sphingomonas sp. TX0543 TaxID=3399682 RepID=UPI003AFA3153
MINLTKAPIDPPKLLGAILDRSAGAGAVVSFCGVARPLANGTQVTGLVLHVHPTLTCSSIEEIVADARGRFAITDASVVHRFGTISPGETVVFVAAAAAHRRAAFGAADYMMDRLKSEAVFWKQELGAGGSRWIEPSEADRFDLARWSVT